MNTPKDPPVEMEKSINFSHVADTCLAKGLCYD